jgi:hypothetical protein
MTLIEQLLEDALMRRNYVVVPGVGAFMADHVPAEISLGGQKVYPPAKKVVFNPKLNANDVFLRNQLCKTSGLDVLIADEEVRIFAEGIRSKLKDGLMVSVGRLGYLYVNNEGEISFNNNSEINWNLESYGLPPVKCVPVALRKPTELRQDAIVIQLNANGNNQSAGKQRNLRNLMGRVLPVAAAVAALVVTGGLVYWASQNNKFQIPELESPASMVNITTSSAQAPTSTGVTQSENTEQETANPIALEGDDLPVTSESEIKSTPNPEPETPIQVTPPVAVPELVPVKPNIENAIIKGKYVVIAGSFTLKINAEIQANKYKEKGFETEILPDPETGFFRVGVQRFMTKEAARAFIAQESGHFNEQIWVLTE